MPQLNILLMFIFLTFNAVLYSQNENQKTMRSFVPKSQAYDIYYPLDYKIEEGDDGIVTITDTASGMNITISSFQSREKATDDFIIAMLNTFFKETYNKIHERKDWNSYKSKFDNLVELKTNFNNANWMWLGISKENSIVIISIDKYSEINQEEINLVRFMIDNLIIN